ncbi:MAG: DUF2029 domain-containing protein [Bacteroidetes bacterium]|jgi:hypothetical protein|nr:DUF2029 domain-containing protein [Bacteroidota bacterium]
MKHYQLSLALLGLVILVIIYAVIRNTLVVEGDFIGYVLVGNHVLHGTDIYQNAMINTWPPLFSIVSVPVAIIDNISPYLSRFLWLAASVWAMFKIIDLTTRLVNQRKLTLFPLKSGIVATDTQISMLHWIVMIPLLLAIRHIWSNLGNIQINIFMLLLAMYSIFYFLKRKYVLGAILLAFSISIKVYTIFLLLYFIVKREYTFAGLTLLFCALFAIIPFAVFGFEASIDYYSTWMDANVNTFATINHKNQSFFSMMLSLLVHESPGLAGPLNQPIYVNILDVSPDRAKQISYAILFLLAIPVILMFKERLSKTEPNKALLEFAFILTLVPILSPLAWKAYFIFLFPGYFISYYLLFMVRNNLPKKTMNILKTSFFIAIALTVMTTELIVGKYLSDVFEAYSCMTIGTIVLAGNILLLHFHYNKFDTRQLVSLNAIGY